LTTARYFSAYPSDPASRRTPCPPKLRERWLQVRLGRLRLSPACPFRLLHTFHSLRPARHYPRFWIQRSSSERWRDLNPPDLGAAQRTLWQSLTSPNRASVTTAPRLPTTDRQPGRDCGRSGDLPVPLTRRLAGSHHRLAGRANSLGVARDLLCLEHLNRTCAPAGWPQRMPSRKSRL